MFSISSQLRAPNKALMKLRVLCLTAVLLMLAITLAACVGSTASAQGKTVFVVSDAAADMGAVTEIHVTIDAARVHAQGGAWTNVTTQTQTFDLLELRDKSTAELLAQVDLKAGTYDELELSISKVVVVDASGEHEAKLPSNKLQLKGVLEVKENATATANFDFLADQSLHITGNGRYIMAPVIKLETRSNATAEVKANNEVAITGGTTKTNAEIGMDAEGNMDEGLRIHASAVLTLDNSGKVAQTGGRAIVTGTIKSVDAAKGIITITTKSGSDVVLNVANDSLIRLQGGLTTLAGLSANVGTHIVAGYDVSTKSASEISTRGAAKSETNANTSANAEASGTLKVVDTANNTITITTKSGQDIVVKMGADSQAKVDGAVSSIAGLSGRIGSDVSVNYNSETKTASNVNVSAQSQTSATVNGTLKAVDVAAGTITVVTQSGTDLTLKTASSTKAAIGTSLSTLAGLAAKVGSQVTVQYNMQTNVASSIVVQGEASASTTTTVNGTLKAVDLLAGTITVTTESGTDLVLKVSSDTRVMTEGAVASMASLAARTGSKVSAQYNAETKVAASVNASAR